ncbi:MAG: PHP domain-containing protein [Clostridia bacterium]|nr:PHP domain-containing protein [Clostridia bacterium]
MKIRYDVHIHSCLSPCGDDSMTPAFIAGSAALEGLDLVALTDHNTAENCPAFAKAAEFYGVSALFGMELTTSEDIHVVCLFGTAEKAAEFSDYVKARHNRPKNQPEIFGRQLVMDEEDNIVREESGLLIYAADIDFETAGKTVFDMGGAAFPAHIDKTANGAVAILGTVPDYAGYRLCEVHDAANIPEISKFVEYRDTAYICDSDAHYPDAIGSVNGEIVLPDGDPAEQFLIYLRRHYRRD